MTARIKGLTVALTHDIQEDDCEAIINAIKMIQGVENVTDIISDSTDWIAKQHVKNEIREKVFKLMDDLV